MIESQSLSGDVGQIMANLVCVLHILSQLLPWLTTQLRRILVVMFDPHRPSRCSSPNWSRRAWYLFRLKQWKQAFGVRKNIRPTPVC